MNPDSVHPSSFGSTAYTSGTSRPPTSGGDDSTSTLIPQRKGKELYETIQLGDHLFTFQKVWQAAFNGSKPTKQWHARWLFVAEPGHQELEWSSLQPTLKAIEGDVKTKLHIEESYKEVIYAKLGEVDDVPSDDEE